MLSSRFMPAPQLARLLSSAAASAATPSPVKHVVVPMMESRSFDRFLGWVPGADGFPVLKNYGF